MRRISTIAAVAGTAVALLTPAAEAASGGATPAGAGSGGDARWIPFRTEPFTTSGVCPFTVHGDILRDEEEVRTDATFPDGSPRIQEFRGPLVIRFTNVDNGKSAVRDVSAYGRLRNLADGGSIWYFDGGFSVRVFIGNRAYPAGWYILNGTGFLTIAPDNTRDFQHLHATVENLCDTLA